MLYRDEKEENGRETEGKSLKRRGRRAQRGNICKSREERREEASHVSALPTSHISSIVSHVAQSPIRRSCHRCSSFACSCTRAQTESVGGRMSDRRRLEGCEQEGNTRVGRRREPSVNPHFTSRSIRHCRALVTSLISLSCLATRCA